MRHCNLAAKAAFTSYPAPQRNAGPCTASRDTGSDVNAA